MHRADDSEECDGALLRDCVFDITGRWHPQHGNVAHMRSSVAAALATVATTSLPHLPAVVDAGTPRALRYVAKPLASCLCAVVAVGCSELVCVILFQP